MYISEVPVPDWVLKSAEVSEIRSRAKVFDINNSNTIKEVNYGKEC
mgnify:FL=1